MRKLIRVCETFGNAVWLLVLLPLALGCVHPHPSAGACALASYQLHFTTDTAALVARAKRDGMTLTTRGDSVRCAYRVVRVRVPGE